MGKPIAEHQAIQLKLGEMAAKTRAAELLVEDAARAYDGGGRVDLEAGMAKWFATETALEVATEAMRIFGANGYSKDYPIERLYRDAPLLIIGEGTNEMQRIIIARRLIARNPDCKAASRPSAGPQIRLRSSPPCLLPRFSKTIPPPPPERWPRASSSASATTS